MNTLHCPSREDWRRFDQGLLQASILTAFDEHLDACEHCAELLESLDEDQDTLLAGLRRDTSEEPVHDDELRQLLNRAAQAPFAGESTVSARRQGADTDDPAEGRKHADALRRLPEIEGYRIARILGQGGMGVVYEAIQLDLDRRVALKTIRAGELANDAQVARFRQEANAAAALDHPHIVSVFEVGECDGLHYFSMAYIDGASLEHVARSKSLDVKTCASLVERLALAMHYAHERGVVHRDLKPDNVMLDSSGEPHLTDFGLARRIEADDRLTSTGQVMGTVGYMSPEQAQGLPNVGPPSDIYSLGAILYRLLAGRAPFQAGNMLESLQQIISVEPPRLRMLRPELDRDLETICLKSLRKSPAERYASAKELSAELRRYLNGEPIQARPLGRLTRAARWCRRKPITVAWMAAVAVLVVICIGAILGARGNANRLSLERQRSELHDRLANLSSFEPDAEVERLLSSLAPYEDEQRNQAQDEYRAALRKLWEQRLSESQRLSGGDVQELERALSHLASWQVADENELRSQLYKRLGEWQLEFHATPDAVDGSPELRRQLVAAKGVLRPSETILVETDRPRRWFTSVPSGAKCELEATFAEGWRATVECGLLLSAEPAGGYEFVVGKTGATESAGRFAEIRRGGVLLLREPVSLPERGPLRIWARREQSRLQMQVADGPTFEFDDLLTLYLSPTLVFGVLWPEEIGLLELHARRPLLPAKPSPLEAADGMFSEGDFTGALRQYDATRASAGTLEQGELLFKRGLCQAQLNRLPRAIDLFQEAIYLNDGRWSTRAACELWHLHLVKGDTEAAERVLDQVRGLNFQAAAQVVPASVRERILREYQSSSGGIANLLQNDPRRVEKAKMAVEVESRLSFTGEPSHNALFRLFEAYDYTGQSALARNTLERLMAGNVEGLTGYYAYHYARQLRQAGDYPQAAAAIKQRLPQMGEQDQEWLRLEQGCLLAAQEQWQLAHDQLTALLDGQVIVSQPGGLPAHLYLSLGFLKQRLGQFSQGEQFWRDATARLRPAMQRVGTSGGELVDFLVMAALANDLTLADVELLTSSMEATPGLASLAVKAVPNTTILNAMQAGWTSPRGRQLAERFAFDQLSRAQKVRSCFQLIGASYCLLEAFGGAATPQQEQLIWELCEEMFELSIESRRIDATTIAALLATWLDKGGTGLVAWQFGASPKLPPTIRGRIAYLMAMRMRAKGNTASADALLKQSVEDANTNSDTDLRQLLEQSMSVPKSK